jgi:hypothetical protein
MLAYQNKIIFSFYMWVALPSREIVPTGRIFLFFSVNDTGLERRSLLLNVCGSHNGKGMYLVVAWYDFS